MVVPALSQWHDAHALAWEAAEPVERLPVHVLLEAASVLSRLPHGLAQPLGKSLPRLWQAFPGEPLVVPGDTCRQFLDALAEAGLGGGAVYDGLVGATARHHGYRLLSLDRRARATYRALGVEVVELDG